MGAGRGRADVGKVIEKAAHLGQVEGAVDLNGIMAGHTRQHGLDNFVVGAGSPRRRQGCEGITVNFHIRIFGEDRGHGSQHDGGTSERLRLKSDTLQNVAKFFEPQHGCGCQLQRSWKQEVLTRHGLEREIPI